MHLERRTIVTRLRSLMDFTLRCVRFYPGVNSRAELVTLAPGLRPERRFAPLARGQEQNKNVFENRAYRHTYTESSIFFDRFSNLNIATTVQKY